MSSDVSVTLRSSKTTFKANISALQSGKSDHRKVSPYPSRHRTAQDTRRTDGARRRPQPTEPWEEYDTDPAMNIIVVLLFPGRKEEPQRAGKPSVVKTHPSIDRMFTFYDGIWGRTWQDISRHLGDAPSPICCYVVWVFESNFGEISNHG